MSVGAGVNERLAALSAAPFYATALFRARAARAG